MGKIIRDRIREVGAEGAGSFTLAIGIDCFSEEGILQWARCYSGKIGHMATDRALFALLTHLPLLFWRSG